MSLAINVRVDRNSAVAEIIVTENDDARGIVQFSSATVNTTEPNEVGFLTVTRLAGTFGSVCFHLVHIAAWFDAFLIQIIIEWTTSTGTASSSDFRPAADIINIPNSQNEGVIPLNIIADGIPEFSEMFTVHLNMVSGGARLGDIQSTTITILPNDDPYGALGITLIQQSAHNFMPLFVTEFISGSRVLTVMEPMDGSTIPVALTVNRNGGTTGIVTAQWQLIRSDGKLYYKLKYKTS